MKYWSNNFRGLLNIFFKSNCPLCQRPTSSEFCLDCTRQLQRCQHKQPNSGWRKPLPVFGWGLYGGTLKRAIAAMKYHNQPQIAYPLAQWLGEAWLNSPHYSQQLAVVPIPLHSTKEKQRGFNQAALIADSFCRTTELNFKQHGLVRIRETTAQFQLSATERQQNLTNAFRIGPDLQSHSRLPVLLVDDIYTTGATAKSAMQTLRQNGIAVYGLVTVAISTQDS